MAFLVWSLLGVSAAYWGLQLFVRPQATPADAVAATESHAERADLSRLLGVTPVQAAEPEVQAQSRMRLIGVVAPKSDRAARAGEGLALIEVDGVARTVRVGARIDGDLQLLRVDAKSASLGLAGQAPTQVLQLTPPAAPATGSLPAAEPSPVVLGAKPDGRGGGINPPDAQPGVVSPPEGQAGIAPVPAAAPTVMGGPPMPHPQANPADNLPRRR
jgi:general secretion pathway protein C